MVREKSNRLSPRFAPLKSLLLAVSPEMTRIAHIVVVSALSCMGQTALEAAKLERSVSTSRQFIVYGPDARLRGALCDLGERTKRSVLALLQEEDRWKTPIVVNARLPEANLPEAPVAQLNFSQTGFGLKLQLDLEIGPDVSAPAVERELLRAVFLEMMYRAQPDTPAGTPYLEPPDWLLEGTLAAAPGRDFSALAESLGGGASANPIPLAQFLQQQPALLESPSRVLYRAYAAALVAMLTEMPEGHARLARFVADLPRAGNESLVKLRAHFPRLSGDEEQLQKSWAESVARFARRERLRFLNCDETEQKLAQLLRLEMRVGAQSPSSYSLEEHANFIKKPEAKESLQKLLHDLLLLSGKAHPLYRSVIAEYQEIVTALGRGRTKKITERLARARATREQITRRMSAVGDYMNWFEATQSRSASGVFEEYLKAAELALEREPRRRDRISVYLDSLETQLGN